MFIKSLDNVKSLIQNNVELFRLHNLMSAHSGDKDVVSVASRAGFRHTRIVWFTEINSLYSSVVLVREYMKDRGDHLNSLDNQFSLPSWFIQTAREFDSNGTNCPSQPDLHTVLKRMRNSIGHGKFELDKTTSSASSWLAVFRDEDVSPQAKNSSKRFFEMQIIAIDLHKFLEKLEAAFKGRYP